MQTEPNKIKTLIIEPYMRHYGALSLEMIDDFVKALRWYSEDVLEQAWDAIKIECETRPKLARIIRACREIQDAQGDKAQATAEQLLKELNEKASNAAKLANSYVAGYLKSPLADEARKAGYLGKVLEYVQSAAFFQAQIIAGVKNRGIDWLTLNDSKMPEFDERVAIQRELERQAASGSIGVTIPTQFLDRWKIEAESRKQKEAA